MKYLWLFKKLEEVGVIKLPENLVSSIVHSSREQEEIIKEIEITMSEAQVEIVYIKPQPDESGQVISFSEISEYLAIRDDDFSVLAILLGPRYVAFYWFSVDNQINALYL